MQELILGIVAIKITAMVIGYLIVRLGFDALVRGIKGEFDFGGKITSHGELRLLSASPGLFFVLFGSAIIIWALAVEKPVWSTVSVSSVPAPLPSGLVPQVTGSSK